MHYDPSAAVEDAAGSAGLGARFTIEHVAVAPDADPLLQDRVRPGCTAFTLLRVPENGSGRSTWVPEQPASSAASDALR